MTKSRPMINSNLSEWYKYLVENVKKTIRNEVSNFSLDVQSILCLNDGKLKVSWEWVEQKGWEYQEPDRDPTNI